VVLALDTEKDLDSNRKKQFALGWQEALKGLDAETATLVKKLDAMLVRVALRSGVLPGFKEYKMNGLDGSWRLRFGDDRALISFARGITSEPIDPAALVFDRVELIKHLYLPEQVFLEVRTDVHLPLPLDEIRLVVQVNDAEVSWNQQPFISASFVEKKETDEAVEIDRRGQGLPNLLVKKTISIYRTQLIELIEQGRGAPPVQPGVFYLQVKPGDKVKVKLEDPHLFSASPPIAVSPVLRTTARDLTGKESLTWKQALTNAARIHGYNITDWYQLSTKEAAEITNTVLSNIFLKGLVRQKVKITVGEHAALLILREALVKSMEQAEKNLPEANAPPLLLRGWRDAIKPDARNEKKAWRFLRVTCPNGGDCPFTYAFNDSYLEKTFGDNRKAADEWSLKATAEALAKYKQAVKAALARARAAADKDVEELLDIIGFGYEELLPQVLPRMMRLGEVGKPPRQLWTADLNARFSIWQLRTVAEAVQAQKDFSKLDTQAIFLAVALLTAPFMLSEAALLTLILWGLDGATLGIQVLTEGYDYLIRQPKEMEFALGASLVLGADRLNEAMLRESGFFERLLNILPSALSVALGALAIPRAVAQHRTALLIAKIEKGGLPALEKLSDQESLSLFNHISEAKLLERLNAGKAITKLHRRASALGDQLLAQMRAKARVNPEPILPQPKPKVQATGNPRKAAKPEKTQTLKAGDLEPEGTLKYEDGEQPTAKIAEVPHQANSQWQTVVNNQVKPFKLGEKLGEGTYATVYELVDFNYPGCEKGCVIKIFRKDLEDVFKLGKNVVNNIKRGAGLLGDDIPQLKNVIHEADAATPYIIQQRRQPEMEVFTLTEDVYVDGKPVINPQTGKIKQKTHTKTYKRFASKEGEGLQQAVVELAYKMRLKGLAMEDFHLENLFFFKENNEWVAGILDQDRIIKFAVRDGEMGVWFDWMEADFGLINPRTGNRRIRSLYRTKPLEFSRVSEAIDYFRKNPGPRWPDEEFFWEKIFEYKQWIYFDETTNTYHPGLITPTMVKKRFPKLDTPERLEPLDVSRPFPKISQLLPAEFPQSPKARGADRLARAA
jgi:hypothetical protein